MKILLADDHALILSGIRALLKHTPFQIIGEIHDGSEVSAAMDELRPDLLILDVHMPNRSGIEVLRDLRARGDRRPIVLLTASLGDRALQEALKLGVDGIVLKDGAENLLVCCLNEIAQGKRWIDADLEKRVHDLSSARSRDEAELQKLSVRETSVAKLVTKGLKNREIGEELGLSEGSVKVYLHRIYEKLGVENRTELAVKVQRVLG